MTFDPPSVQKKKPWADRHVCVQAYLTLDETACLDKICAKKGLSRSKLTKEMILYCLKQLGGK